MGFARLWNCNSGDVPVVQDVGESLSARELAFRRLHQKKE